MRVGRAGVSLGGALALLLFSAASWATPPAVDAGAWIARATARRLGEEPQWLRLLHYERTLFGWKSRAEESPFFLTGKSGRTSPAEELEAFLQHAFEPAGEGRPPVLCRFPARRSWLEGRLDGLADALPAVDCPEFDAYVRQVGATGASLVFSSYFLEAPASAFGHTLLRLHRTDARDGTELLDFGINYAAEVDTENALLYGLKGLFGLFPGQLTAQPYYYKVREYNDYESRDLWEYELELDSDELAMLVAHVWELGSARFSYWYASENCSFFMLAMLEAAVGRWSLTGGLPPWTVPVDTVKALVKAGGVRDVRYRPSAREVLRARSRTLSTEELALAQALVDEVGQELPATLPKSRAAAVLDVAIDAFDVRNASAVLLSADAQIEAERRTLLGRRSEIPLRSVRPALEPRASARPHESLGSQRLELGVGWTRNADRWFMPLGYRVALHDFAESSRGFGALARIEFLSTALRVGHEQTGLERLSLVRAGSFVPWTSFQKRMSWTFDAGVRGAPGWACATCLSGYLGVGSGVTFATDARGVAFVLLVSTAVEGGPGVDGVWSSPVRLVVSPTATLRFETGPFTFAMTGGYDLRLSGAAVGQFVAEGEARVVLTPRLSVFARGLGSERAVEASGGVGVYF